MQKFIRQAYQKHKRDLYTYVFYRVKNQELARDIVAEVFLRLTKNIHKPGVKKYLRAWLFRVARNLVVDYYRDAYYSKSRSLKQGLVEDDAYAKIESKIDSDKQLKMLSKCFKLLSPAYREIIEFRVFMGLPYREISVVLNISESSAKMRYKRAIDKLKQLCSDEKIKSAA